MKLNFKPEDTSPPKFSAMIYEHDGITSEEQTQVVSIVITVPLKSDDFMFPSATLYFASIGQQFC